MDEFCPLCRKNGCSNKIKPVQLNFHEAVYLCESEKCHWPYGYEEFKIIPRSIDEIGKISPKKSNIKNEVQKTKDGTNIISISTELSMYTPPVTPSNDSSSSKEIVKGTTTSSILDDIFNSITTTNNDHSNDVSHSGKSMKPPSQDSYASINNSTSKTALTSSIIGVKNENMPPKVPSIFDIDSSVTLSADTFGRSQIDTVNYCDIKNDGKNNHSPTLNSECSAMQSSTLFPKGFLQIRNVQMTDVDIKEMKPKKKIKSTVGRKSQSELNSEQISDQLDSKLNKKVVIFKEKLSNGIVLSEDKILNEIINRKRPSSDDNNPRIMAGQSPKKIQRVSNNQELIVKNDEKAVCASLNELSVENCTPIIKNICDVSIDVTTGQSQTVNNSQSNILDVPSIESKEPSMIGNSLDTSMSVVDSLNLDSFINDNFLDNCPNSTQEIDDEWLQSFLI